MGSIRFVALILLLSCRGSAETLASPASANCEARGGKIEIFDTEGGQIGYCRLGDHTAIEEWTLLKGGKTKAAKAFANHRKLRASIAASEDATGTAVEHCERAGGKVAVLGRKGATLSACFFLDRSSIDADSLFEGPKRRPVLARLLK